MVNRAKFYAQPPLHLLAICAVLLMSGPPQSIGQQTLRPRPGSPRSGPIDYKGFVRVIDGDTVEIYQNGSQIGIGILGIDAPPGNTPCGRQATQLLQRLAAGGLYFAEDQTLEFDRRKRRLYYATTRDYRKVAKELIKAGLAHSTHEGKEKEELDADEIEAQGKRIGCLFGGRPLNTLEAAGNNGLASENSEDSQTEKVHPDVEPRMFARAAISLAGGFSHQLVASGFTVPTAFAFLPGGRILVAEKQGVVKVIKNGAILPAPFIDISNRVHDYWDHGLIGISVDPNFATNGYIYLAYTYENNPSDFEGTKTARVSRYTATGDTASPSSELVILGTSVGSSCQNFPAGADCIPSESPSHSVGQIKFDSAGNMFVTAGDGASFNVVDDLALRTLDLSSLAGKILRVSPIGAGLPTNPFWNGSASSNRSKVWGYGVRNAFRFNLRSGSYPYLGDVGWDTWEEINAVTAGVNLGWPCYEGNMQQPGYASKSACQALYAQGPSAVRSGTTIWNHFYAGQQRSSAALGGTFYTGTLYPEKYRGAYFFGDFAQNWLRYITVDASDNVTSGPFDFMFGANGPGQIEQGIDGNLYYLSIASSELRRIVFNGPDTTAPTVTTVAPEGTGIALNALVTATFSELLDPNRITNNLTVVRQSTGQPISGTLVYEGNTQTITFTPSASSQLQANATYLVTVKGGSSGIRDLEGNPLAADRTWTFTTVNPQPPPSGTTNLSSLTWSAMNNGWGPAEINRSNGEQAPGDGVPIRIRGTPFANGIGVHANSDIHYFLGNSCSTFAATIGIDDEVAPNGSVVFQVFGDGVKLYDSGVITGTAAPQNVNVSIAGRHNLQLVVTDADNGNAFDHADWALARVTCSSAPTTTISNVQASGITSTTATITWTTNNVADSQVEYGTTTSYGSATPINSSLVTAHSVELTGLSANTTYHYRVKSRDFRGTLVMSNDGTFITSFAGTTTTYLSDLTWTSMTNGWGPVEKDMSNGEQGTGDGRPLSIRGVVYPKGLGVHAASSIQYSVTGCRTFAADVGIDDEVRPNGSVIFQVFADGTKLYDSGAINGTVAARPVNLNITGKSQLNLVVVDDGGGLNFDHADWGGALVTCGGSPPPTVTITAPAPTLKYKVGDVVAYSGSATDASGTAIPPSRLTWEIIIHHCPNGSCHTHSFITATGSSGDITIPDHGDDSFFEFMLTATDSAGLDSSKAVSIQPQTVQLTLATVPTGLSVVYGGSTLTAPATMTTAVGSKHTVQTPSPQGVNVFSLWSDGGAQQHEITIGTSNLTLTATFTSGGTPLVVSSTSPVNGATGVSVNSAVTATFSRAIDPATLNSSTFSLAPAVTGTATYSAATFTGTFTPSAALQNGTTYTATVKGGATGVKDPGGNSLSADTVWSFTTASATSTAATFVSDLTWTSMTNGWGPVEVDMSNNEQAGGDGRPISIRDIQYLKGLGAHAPSDVRYAIPTGCTTFTANVGIDDEVAPNGSVVFQVWADGTKLYDSGAVTGTMPVQNASANIAGRTQLQLVVTNAGDNNDYDHASWGNAHISCPVTRPPVGISQLSDLNWTFVANGWGPAEKDMSNGEQASGDGRPLSIRGTTYPKGLGIHAGSDIRYNLGGACTTFNAIAGIDDEVGPNGSVVFQVWTDGVKVYDSALTSGTADGKNVSVDLTGKNQLRLVVTDGGDGPAFDHANWANARINCP